MRALIIALAVVLALLWATAEAANPHDWWASTTNAAGDLVGRFTIKSGQDVSSFTFRTEKQEFGNAIGNEVNYVWAGPSSINADPNGATKNPNIRRQSWWGPGSTGSCVWNSPTDHPGCILYMQQRDWIDYPNKFGGSEMWVLDDMNSDGTGELVPVWEYAQAFIQFNSYGSYRKDFLYHSDHQADWRATWLYDASKAQMILTRAPFIENPDMVPTAPSTALHIHKGDLELTDSYLVLDGVTGAPPVADCDVALERGRMKVDPAAGLLYVCMNSGWVAK